MPDRQRFGWGFWGAEERNRSTSYTFSEGNEALTVSARGFDIDEADEVAVYINGDRVGYLAPGADGRIYPVPNQFNLPLEDQQAVNTVTFMQTRTTGWVWGVTDVLVEPNIDSTGEPMLGAATPIGAGPSSGAYGWNYPGAEAYLEAVDLSIETDGTQDLELLMRGFDIDFADEVYVSVGSTLLGYLDLGRDNALSEDSTRFVIPSALQAEGETIVRVGQAHHVGYSWGVTDISVAPIDVTPDPASLADATLTIDAPASGTYGWQFTGAQQTETEVSLYIPTSADDLDGLEGIDIELTGYDVDGEDAVEVLLNGISLGFLHPTLDGEVSECFDTFFVPKSDLSADNYLVVRQVKQIGDRWGVQDVTVVGRYGP